MKANKLDTVCPDACCSEKPTPCFLFLGKKSFKPAVKMDDASLPGRSVDIELGGQEVITIDLDNLDPNPDDVLDLLKEGQCTIFVWTKLAGEYWRRGYLEAAERIALTAIECMSDVELRVSLLTSISRLSS
jgi:RNA polymerase-associated protein CTR9